MSYNTYSRIQKKRGLNMHFKSQTLNKLADMYMTYELMEEEDDWDDFMALFGDDECLLDDDNHGNYFKQRRRYKKKWKHIRLQWTYHVTQLLHEGFFKQEYRMSYDAWNKLFVILSPALKPKRKTNHPVTTQIIIALGLRWLTGTDVNCCRHIFHMSRTEAYRCVHKFMYAVLKSKCLQIRLPKTKSQWTAVKNGFRNKSTRGVMIGCCGALDGLFILTNQPRYSDVSNVRAYYSGHYEHFGINCQGMCDAYLRFLYFGIVAPGSTNDNVAYTRTGELIEAIESLDLGEYIVADAAYTVTEHLWTPFTGAQRDDEAQDAFNFYLSQLRIRIEMAFGLLVKKFSILKKPLPHKLSTSSRIIMCCAQLHNFIINYDGTDIPEDETASIVNTPEMQTVNGETLIPSSYSPGGLMVYQPTMVEDGFQEIIGISNSRRAMVEFLNEHGFKRPEYNLIRNSRLRQLTKKAKEGSATPNGSRHTYKEVEISQEYFHPQ